jgi:cobalt-zinc-cadmium efflux system outer membrane protein
MVSGTFLVGCVSVPREAGFPDVQKIVQERIGEPIRWNQGRPEDAEVEKALGDLLRAPLTPEAAVRIALLWNPSLQATYEDLGIAQADLVQAGLLRNPVIFGSIRFPTAGGGGMNPEFSIVQSFLDVFFIPARTRIAGVRFERTKLTVAKRVLDLAADVKGAYYSLVGALQVARMREMVARAAETSAELARRLHEAGNLSDLNLANEESLYQMAKVEWAKAQTELLAAREKLTRLLGLWGKTAEWKPVERLPEVPKEEIALDHLESLAVGRRLDLAALRREEQAIAQNLDLVRTYRWLGSVNLGVDGERDRPGHWVVGPNLSFELPLFDQQQAVIFRLESELRQSQARISALAVEIRSEARAVRDRLLMTRYRIEHYRDEVVPLRERIVKLTQERYSFMLVGAFELIDAKGKEFEAYQQYIEAVRDYWIVRSELERATDGEVGPRRP